MDDRLFRLFNEDDITAFGYYETNAVISEDVLTFTIKNISYVSTVANNQTATEVNIITAVKTLRPPYCIYWLLLVREAPCCGEGNKLDYDVLY